VVFPNVTDVLHHLIRVRCAQVIVAGTSQQVQDALEEAEEFREPLEERGVMVIPLPIFEDSNAEKDKQNQLTDKDLK